MENENREYQVIISEQATQMLVSHAAFLAQVNTESATKLVSAFKYSAASLSQMPQRCPWLHGDYIPPNKYMFLVIKKRYLLIFQIIDDTVYIDYVVDCLQDYKWLLR
jgi:predicted chitinase